MPVAADSELRLDGDTVGEYDDTLDEQDTLDKIGGRWLISGFDPV